MFGDDYIIGQNEFKIDDKGRMLVPKYTYGEAGEKLLIKEAEFDNEYALRLLSYKKNLEIINSLIEKRKQCKSKFEYNKYTLLIDELFYSFKAIVKIEKNHRIAIGKHFNDWDQDDTFIAFGAGDSLLIRKKY